MSVKTFIQQITSDYHGIPFCPYLVGKNLHQEVSQQEMLFYIQNPSSLVQALLHSEEA